MINNNFYNNIRFLRLREKNFLWHDMRAYQKMQRGARIERLDAVAGFIVMCEE